MQVVTVDNWMPAAQSGNHRVLVRFSVRTKQKEKLNEKGELTTVWEDVEYIEKRNPGEKDLIDRPVLDKDRREFAAAYNAFKSGLAAPINGMPLSELPGATGSEV